MTHMTHMTHYITAWRQALSESNMYHQGSGWVTSIWDPAVQCRRVSNERHYGQAQYELGVWRRERTAELIGPHGEST